MEQLPGKVVDNILTAPSIERGLLILCFIAIIALYRRANHLADLRVADVQATVTTTNAALSETTRALDTLSNRLEGIGRG